MLTQLLQRTPHLEARKSRAQLRGRQLHLMPCRVERLERGAPVKRKLDRRGAQCFPHLEAGRRQWLMSALRVDLAAAAGFFAVVDACGTSTLVRLSVRLSCRQASVPFGPPTPTQPCKLAELC